MAKTALGAALIVVFLAGSAWVVHREGEAHRRSWASRKSELEARLLPELRGRDQPKPVVVEVPKPEEEPEPSKKVDLATLDANPVPPPRPEVAAPPKEKPKELEPPPPAPPPKPKRKLPPAVEPVAPDRAATALTVEEEREVGAALHDLILQRHQPLPPGPLQRRLLEAARPVLALRTRKEIEPRLTILDSEEVFSFSHMGGYIYVSKGLFNLVHDDAEVQFVVAHELAHIDLKHGAEQVARAMRGAETDGEPGLVQRSYHQIALGHAEDQEFAADARAFRQLGQLDRSRRETLAFPRRLAAFVERHGLSGRQKPKTGPGDEVQPVERHWLTHPPALDRLERLMALPPAP